MQWAIGIFQPSAIGASTPGGASGVVGQRGLPVHAAATGRDRVPDGEGAAKASLLWVNAEWQDAKSEPAGLSGTIDTLLSQTVNAGGVGGGAKLDLGGWSFVGSGYWGRGIGTTLQFSSISAWTPPALTAARTATSVRSPGSFRSKWSLTGSYGESFVSATNADKADLTYPALLKYNSHGDGLLIYQWTKSVKYVIEYGYDAAANVAGGKDISNSLSTGFMLFF